jgi:flagellar hook-associated protein 2
MGAIGLNFGSPTSGQGFDVTTTVAAIVANLAETETPYTNQLATLTSQDTVISKLGTLMNNLSNDITNFTSPTGTLASMEGSSSNTNVLELTSAGTGAVAGSHSITVETLASTSSKYASPVASTDTLAGTLSITVGGNTVAVPVGSGDTISSFAAAINASGAGVTASVITGNLGEQLSLTSSTSGAAGTITLDASQLTDATTNTAITFATATPGADATLMVDGIAATSSSNTVSTIIPGVTFQLLDASTTPVQVEITNDVSSVSTAVASLVSDYNAVVTALGAQEGNTSAGAASPLYGNPLIATIQNDLSGAISANTGSGSSALNLSTAGITLNSDGTLTLDSDTLTTALNSNFNGVVGLFQNAGGVGESLATVLLNDGNAEPDSVLTLAASDNASQETSLNATLTALKANVSAQQTQLTSALNAANEALQLIPVQLQEVSELYSALTGYGTSNS